MPAALLTLSHCERAQERKEKLLFSLRFVISGLAAVGTGSHLWLKTVYQCKNSFAIFRFQGIKIGAVNFPFPRFNFVETLWDNDFLAA